MVCEKCCKTLHIVISVAIMIAIFSLGVCVGKWKAKKYMNKGYDHKAGYGMMIKGGDYTAHRGMMDAGMFVKGKTMRGEMTEEDWTAKKEAWLKMIDEKDTYFQEKEADEVIE